MITRVFVFDRTGNPSHKADVEPRHEKILNQINGFKVFDHISLHYDTDREGTIREWDKPDALIIAHFSDMPIHFEELMALKNAIVICHTDSWDNSDPLNDPRLKDKPDMRNENYHLTGSKMVKENMGAFIKHLKETGKIDFDILQGFPPLEA